MRYCHQCNRMTAGDPLFCNFCGRSYDVKLCPHRHPNPRTAEVCNQCGSRDLSTPHPQASLIGKLLVKCLSGLIFILPGVAWVLVTILVVVALLRALIGSSQFEGQFIAAAVLVIFGWWIYMQLPAFLKKLFSRHDKRKHSNGQ